MTVDAIRSLKKHSPNAAIGVIIPPNISFEGVSERLKSALPEIQDLIIKQGKQNFEKWNPTQHKLDISLFSDQYDPICWVDSDVAVLKDLLPQTEKFFDSGKQFAFLSDHVNRDPNFLQNWEDGPDNCFVPQACYMIVRSSIIREFFLQWETKWKEWIEPEPFKNHRNPAPQFSGSSFCIEQYALGQSLLQYVSKERFDELVLVIERSQLFIDPSLVSVSGQLQTPGDNLHIGMGVTSHPTSLISSFPSSYPTSYPTSQRVETEQIIIQLQKGQSSAQLSFQTAGLTFGQQVTSAQIGISSLSLSSAQIETSALQSQQGGALSSSKYMRGVGLTSARSILEVKGIVQSGGAQQQTGVTSYQAQAIAAGVTSYKAQTIGSGVTSYNVGQQQSQISSYNVGQAQSQISSLNIGGLSSYAPKAAVILGQTKPSSGAAAFPAQLSANVVPVTFTLSSASQVPTSFNLPSSAAQLSLSETNSLQLPTSAPSSAPTTVQALDNAQQLVLQKVGTIENNNPSNANIYATADRNFYVVSNNTASTDHTSSGAPTIGTQDYMMVDLIGEQSIAHYYNVNFPRASQFIGGYGDSLLQVLEKDKKDHNEGADQSDSQK
ncbi:MAG: hypothetical protein EZS28_009782 [Streblomastix strix]|uniref:Nucleotide-diphospho-sugar transferase domain-containing protein n=1 Tax=Streblomastix strix TaxID=222440 RepID=A0A5J4WK76_9EUKA|nr:MAG: hypothetical protein EZS28_009782 [Streblomastix strix]